MEIMSHKCSAKGWKLSGWFPQEIKLRVQGMRKLKEACNKTKANRCKWTSLALLFRKTSRQVEKQASEKLLYAGFQQNREKKK